MIFLSNEEVETLAKIIKNTILYDNRTFKINRVTNEGYYITEIKK